ncbi:MAG: hypothetical protein LH479_14275 [Polaromonas sp.]|nr:hypothetical protein [Polaromonas sp.]
MPSSISLREAVAHAGAAPADPKAFPVPKLGPCQRATFQAHPVVRAQALLNRRQPARLDCAA